MATKAKARSSSASMKAQTSIKIFRQFIKPTPNGLDASGVLSKECYQTWLESRKKQVPDPEKHFQRTVSAHLTALDGRVPFTEDEENAILAQVRKKQVWPCFQGMSEKQQVGITGFRSQGFHERQRLESKRQRVEQQPQQPVAPPQKDSSLIDDVDPFLPAEVSTTSTPGSPLPPMLDLTMPQPHMLRCQSAAAAAAPCVNGDCNTFLNVVPSIDSSVLFPIVSKMMSVATLPSFAAWDGVFSFAKSLIASNTPASLFEANRTTEYARQLCNQASLNKGPNVFVMVCNKTARESSKRVLAQNQKCIEVLGNLVDNAPILTRADELFNCALMTGATLSNPGKEFSVRMYFKCIDNVERLFDMTFCVDPNSYLTIQTGKLVEQ